MESRSIAPTTGTSLLLAAVGRESSDEAVVWQYAPADSRAVASGGIAEAAEPSQKNILLESLEGCTVGGSWEL